MKPLTPTETESLLERTRDALDECLDVLAAFRAVAPIKFPSGMEHAQHSGQNALDQINEVLRPIYATPEPAP